MRLIPVFTEKSLEDAKNGKYTFWVSGNLTKYQIKNLINTVFDVHAVKVRTVKLPGEVKRTFQGRKKVITSKKKAIVTLRPKEKIDLFDENKKNE